MMALTLKHPWPFCVVALGKDVENRVWRPRPWQLKPGQDFCLHGGKAPTGRAALEDIADEARGLIEDFRPAAAAFMAARGLDDITLETVLSFTGLVAVARFDGCVTGADSPWFEGPFGWRLADVRVLPEPVPIGGAQGLWRLPTPAFEAVRAALEGVPS